MYWCDQLKRRATKTQNVDDWENFKRQKSFVNKKVKRVKKSFYRTEIEQNRGDFKGTWRVLNNLMNCKSNNTMINEIKISSSESATNPKDIADTLNQHFIEIGQKLVSEIPDPPKGKSFESFMKQSISKFKLQKVEESKALELLLAADSAKATQNTKQTAENCSTAYLSILNIFIQSID